MEKRNLDQDTVNKKEGLDTVNAIERPGSRHGEWKRGIDTVIGKESPGSRHGERARGVRHGKWERGIWVETR